MKHLKMLLILTLVAALALTVAGCDLLGGQPEETQPTVVWTPKETEAPTETTPPTDAPVETDPADHVPATQAPAAAFTAMIVAPENVEVLTDYNHYVDSDSEYAVNVVFTGDVTDFCFMQVETQIDEEGKLSIVDQKSLYGLDSFDGKPLVINMEFAEFLATRAVSFTDEQGVAQFYLLSQSGEDGSLVLSPVD